MFPVAAAVNGNVHGVAPAAAAAVAGDLGGYNAAGTWCSILDALLDYDVVNEASFSTELASPAPEDATEMLCRAMGALELEVERAVHSLLVEDDDDAYVPEDDFKVGSACALSG